MNKLLYRSTPHMKSILFGVFYVQPRQLSCSISRPFKLAYLSVANILLNFINPCQSVVQFQNP